MGKEVVVVVYGFGRQVHLTNADLSLGDRVACGTGARHVMLGRSGTIQDDPRFDWDGEGRRWRRLLMRGADVTLRRP